MPRFISDGHNASSPSETCPPANRRHNTLYQDSEYSTIIIKIIYYESTRQNANLCKNRHTPPHLRQQRQSTFCLLAPAPLIHTHTENPTVGPRYLSTSCSCSASNYCCPSPSSSSYSTPLVLSFFTSHDCSTISKHLASFLALLSSNLELSLTPCTRFSEWLIKRMMIANLAFLLC